jgi:transcriptional antiterminator NusG
MKWYILQARANFEKKVAEAIKDKAEKAGVGDLVEEVVIPTEKVSEIKKGKKTETERKCLPGYIFIKVDMTDQLWHVIKQIPKVGGFLGAEGKPQEVSEEEVQRITKQIESSVTAKQQALRFETGESVKVNEGPFESFLGTVEEVDDSKQRLRVLVMIFGRSTPVDLGFHQVSKV